MGLEWRTDEEKDTVWQAGKEPPRLGRERPWWGMVMLVLVVATAVWLGRWAGQSMAEQERQAQAEVVASYELLGRASQQRDVELLRLLLSGRDLGWSYEQQSQLLKGQLLARPFTGWHHLPSQEHITVTLSQNLQEAHLTIDQTYAVAYHTAWPGVEYPLWPAIQLRQQVYFERGASRWLYAPPPPEWAGETQQIDGRWLTTSYPAEEAAYAYGLHGVVEEVLGRYCAELGRLCPAPEPIHLILSHDPATLPTLLDSRHARWEAKDERGWVVRLPSFSLVGQPVDETAALLLYQQYTMPLLTAANKAWVVGGRRNAEPLDAILRQAQWAEWGWPPQLTISPTLNPVYWPDLLDYQVVWQGVGDEAELTGRAQQLGLFLQELTAVHDPITWQRQLSQPTFGAWLEQSTGLAWWQIERAWERHIDTQSAPPPVGVRLPSQVVSLLCVQSNQAVQYVTISRWGEEAPHWAASHTLGSAARYQFGHWALPGDDGFVLQQLPLDPADNHWYTLVVYEDGGAFQVFDGNTSRTPLTYTGLAHPSGRPLVMSSPDPELGFAQYHLLVPEECTAEDCPLTASRGLPTWSPTGEQSLLASFQGLHVGDGVGQRLVRLEPGTHPFWLGPVWYGYLRPMRLIYEEGQMVTETAVVLGRLNGTLTGKEEVLTAAQILGSVPPHTLPEGLRYRTGRPLIDHVVAHPQGDELVVAIHLHNQPERYIIRYQPAYKQGRLLFRTTAEMSQLVFSPRGEWLMATMLPNAHEGLLGQVVVYDWQAERAYEYGVEVSASTSFGRWLPDWSADEEWLVLTDAQSAHLISPRQHSHQRLFHDYLTCGQAAWVNE